MTTRELLYIKTIADEGSMTRAAQKLFVTQPSLSHCVMNIEQQLGTRLFTRTSGGLVRLMRAKNITAWPAKCCASMQRLNPKSAKSARWLRAA